jgi:hypothetical protein
MKVIGSTNGFQLPILGTRRSQREYEYQGGGCIVFGKWMDFLAKVITTSDACQYAQGSLTPSQPNNPDSSISMHNLGFGVLPVMTKEAANADYDKMAASPPKGVAAAAAAAPPKSSAAPPAIAPSSAASSAPKAAPPSASSQPKTSQAKGSGKPPSQRFRRF